MRPFVLIAVISAGSAACALDWGRLDPRGGEPGAGGERGGTGGDGTTTSSTTATTSNTGGVPGVGGGAGGMEVGGAGGMGGAGPSPVTLSYTAAVADCIYIGMEDPDVCATAPPIDTMTVDSSVSSTMLPGHSYLRFDLDGQLSGKTVTEVRLRLTVSDDMNAASVSTGEVHEVAPFSRMDLFVAAPMSLGLLGGDQGAVMPNDVVEWPLPNALVAPNGSVFLGLLPLNADGVDYWNAKGLTPPVLLVTME